MKPANKIFLYSLYAVAALLVFLYFRFPSKLMKEIIVSQVQKAQPEVELEADTVSPTIPPGIELEPLLVRYAQMPIFRLDHLKITPHLLSFIGSNKRYDVYGEMGQGNLSGQIETSLATNVEQSQISFKLSRMPMEFIEILNQFQGVRPDGQMDAKINFDSAKSGGTAEVNFEITPAHITLDPPVMGLESLEFEMIRAQLTVSPRLMQIRSCDASGGQVEGKITGTIVFLQPMSESKITLSVMVKPQPAFVAEHKNDLIGGLLASENAQKRGLVFRISGTLGNPNYIIR